MYSDKFLTTGISGLFLCNLESPYILEVLALELPLSCKIASYLFGIVFFYLCICFYKFRFIFIPFLVFPFDSTLEKPLPQKNEINFYMEFFLGPIYPFLKFKIFIFLVILFLASIIK